MKAVFITLITLICCGYGHAQSLESISGEVVDQDGNPLFGNAILLSPGDSSVLTGVPFFEGHFELLDVNRTEVLLKLNSLTFQDTVISIKYRGQSDVSLGVITVRESLRQLDEVTITAKSPLIVENADGSVAVKVANTTLATSTSVEEILGKSPGVVVSENSAVSVFGKGEAVIFLNGIRVDNERLSGLSPSMIESIEIISNPGPRYDAEGNAVINIITKQQVDEGAKGTVKNYFSHSGFGGYQNRTDIDYQYSMGRWALNSNAAYLQGEHRHVLETTRIRDTESEYFSSDLKTDRLFDLDGEYNYGLGGQYNFGKDHYLSVQYTGAYELLGGEQWSDNRINYTDTGIYKSVLHYDEQSTQDNISSNYFIAFDTTGSNLFIGMQYASYSHQFDNDISQLSIIKDVASEDFINNTGANKTDIFSLQADFNHQLSESIALEAGVKISRALINSQTTFYDVKDSTKVINETLSNNFDYDEKVPAAYLNAKGALGVGIHYSAGLRAEYTYYRLNTSVAEGRKIGEKYMNVFPAVSINKKWSDGRHIYLTYASRISRAPYERLNPFVTYQDAFTSIQGNPDLRPSVISALELGSTYRGWSIKTAYTYTHDPRDGGAFQSETDPKTYILQRTNLSRGHLYNLTLSKNIALPWWRSVNTASMSYSKLVDEQKRFSIGESRPFYYLYSQNSFDIADWVTLYVTAWYLSNKEDGINDEFDLSAVNLGLEKELLNGKLKVNLDFNDIFHETRYDGQYTLGLTDIVYYNTMNTNNVRFSLTYNFGRLKKHNFRNKNVGEEETQRAR